MKIVFFSIPAYGHTNPTISVINELTMLGHEVWFYSFNEFKDKIEAAKAAFISCDEYLPEAPKNLDKIVGKDFAALIEMVTATTVSLDEKVCGELLLLKPDCIVSDSICFWGKLFAYKLNIPYVCSTTTFAFNQYTARLMQRTFGQFLKMLTGMPRINKCIKVLNQHGYPIKNFISIIQNDNETNTIVYTSKEFQPMAETFSDKYSFIGPSVMEAEEKAENKEHPLVYISLGTVNNKNDNFYRNCIEAFKKSDLQVIMSVGEKTDCRMFGDIPANFTVKNKVNQIQTLKNADVFLSHCGMNSVNESLYYEVPLVLFPQQEEQLLVAKRVEELGAGRFLAANKVESIYETVREVLNDKSYKINAQEISKGFHNSGGSKSGALAILKVITDCEKQG